MPVSPPQTVHPNPDGTINLAYNPKKKGIHEVNISFNDKSLDDSPFRFHVDSLKSGYVTAYGAGLAGGSSGKEARFSVVGGGSGVTVGIDGPGKADITKKEVKNGVMDVHYIPVSPGEYEISIKVAGAPIFGSPFSAKISGEGRKRSQFSLPGSSEISLGGGNIDLANMVGVMKHPDGVAEPCLLKKTSDGQLGLASFAPKKKGKYSIEVTCDGQKINGSPFKVDVREDQVANAAHVVLHGNCMKTATANEWNEIGIDISKAGYGPIAMFVEGAHRSNIEYADDSRGHYTVKFKPHEPGIYLLGIKFAEEHLAGSPFMVNVGGEPSGRVRETATSVIEAAQPTTIGSKCEFQLKIPGTNPLDMEAALTSPGGKSELCEVMDLAESLYDIKFVPQEEGIHIVSLKYKGLHIAGSPFQYTVGASPCGGTYKVEIGGPGLEKGEVDISNEFNIYTREAGSGDLSVAVEGPSKACLKVVDRGSGYTTVSYTVEKAGEYGIHVKFNDEHVPDSPAVVYILPESAAAKAVTIHGLRDRGLDVGKPVTFNINLNGARGRIHALVDIPSGTVDDCFVQELDMDLLALRFVPKENGVHYVSIRLDEAHIPGSPFPMLIGKMAADPALVLANGDGLEKGETGKPSTFQVITTNSGHGTLNVTVEGPSRVAIRCTEIDEGYQFTYTPMKVGDYLINIKYSNVTIAACPRLARVTGSGKTSDTRDISSITIETVEKKQGATMKKRFHGDATKVVLKGNGLKKAFQNRPGTFNIDVNGAGNDLLLLGLVTPSGNPVEELSYKKQRATIYQVNFRTKEKGDHSLTVRWGPDDVPGSPFTISIV